MFTTAFAIDLYPEPDKSIFFCIGSHSLPRSFYESKLPALGIAQLVCGVRIQLTHFTSIFAYQITKNRGAEWGKKVLPRQRKNLQFP
jgi:hypothetical protein